MRKKLVLQPTKATCASCSGDYFAAGQPNLCPYLRRLTDEFVGRLRWERVRFRVEKDADTSVCEVKFQIIQKDAGIVTLGAVFKTVHTKYAKVCSLEVNAQGGKESEILDSIENIVKHNLPL